MYRLRELEREDVPIINAWRTSRELISFLGSPYRYINREVEYKWYDNYMSSRNTTIRCTIINDKDEVIGLVSLTNIDRINQIGNFHIMIGDCAQREKGIGYFATKEILNHAFNDMNLNRIELTVLEGNKRAIKLYEKIGFQTEGVKRKAVFKNGKFIDMIMMAILKEDFQCKEVL